MKMNHDPEWLREKAAQEDGGFVSLEELQRSGILQETNHRWFHPLGLALAVVEEEGKPRLEIIDVREDPEGMVFVDGVMDREKSEQFLAFMHSRYEQRQAALGFVIQPEGPASSGNRTTEPLSKPSTTALLTEAVSKINFLRSILCGEQISKVNLPRIARALTSLQTLVIRLSQTE